MLYETSSKRKLSPPVVEESAGSRSKRLRTSESAGPCPKDGRKQRWQSFVDHWYGNKEAFTNTGDIIEIPDFGVLFSNTGLFRTTQGKFYVREEYKSMYDRLRRFHLLRDNSAPPGVILTGQQGIGKSNFGLYVLLWCLAEKQDVFYTMMTTTVIIQSGIVSISKTFCFEDWYLPNPNADASAHRPWMLVEPGAANEPITPDMLHFPFFFVVFASPGESRLQILRRGDLALTQWIMSPWTTEELFLLMKHGLLPKAMCETSEPDEDTMRATVTRYSAEAGPCPRDMIHLFRDKRLFYHNIEKALWSLADVHVAPLSFDLNKWSGTISPDEDTMRATVMRYSEEAVPCAREILGLLFGRRAFDAGIRRSPMRLDNLQPLFTPDRWTQTDYFSLIMIDRDGPIDVNNYCDDRMRIRLKTKGVSERLWRHSLQLRETTGTTFFSIVGQGTSILAGTAFMGIALRALSVNLHYSAMDNISGQFVRMSPSPPASQAFPHRFTYRPSTPTHLLSVEGITLELRAHRGLSLADEPLPSLPSPFVRRRECVQYKDLQEVYVNDSDFYVPSTHTNPPFDAFYFETSPEKVVLWVFQVTVQQAADRDTHTSSGFDLIVDLLAKVRDSPEHRNAQVEVKYVLVVPQSTEWAVEWNMAPEWEEVPGEVYIQFIDASVLASYCRPMDIVEYTQDG